MSGKADKGALVRAGRRVSGRAGKGALGRAGRRALDKVGALESSRPC